MPTMQEAVAVLLPLLAAAWLSLAAACLAMGLAAGRRAAPGRRS